MTFAIVRAAAAPRSSICSVATRAGRQRASSLDQMRPRNAILERFDRLITWQRNVSTTHDWAMRRSACYYEGRILFEWLGVAEGERAAWCVL